MALRAAALLAAGGGTRFEGSSHKLLALLDGRPVWQWALTAMMDAEFDVMFVVTGAVALDLPANVVELHNPRWAQGHATSLRCAVAAADDAGADSLTVGLADQPHVPGSAWRCVGHAPAQHPIVVATYDGRPGPHPVRLTSEIWPMLPDDGDEGARGVLQSHPELVHRVACEGSAEDIDTLDDLARVADLLGRKPEGDFEVAVRDEHGEPLVLRNAPLMHNGRPMPTLYWLAGKVALRDVSRLEAAGGVRTAEAEVDADALAAAHARYAAERDARLPVDYRGPRPSGGVAGTRHGVKCLHAHYAYYLAGGDDPVGRWVAARLAQRQGVDTKC
jgi:CTP:molybdopterin cytidylyltransferase MocA